MFFLHFGWQTFVTKNGIKCMGKNYNEHNCCKISKQQKDEEGLCNKDGKIKKG